ncbi:MAG: cyclase family protein [Planctomycetota bacterium]
MILHDISPRVSPRTAVFPGDTPFSAERLMDMESGSHLTLTRIVSTPHVGAHADAPSHYGRGASDASSLKLERYLGACRVLRVRPSKGLRLMPADAGDGPFPGRVLFRTDSFPNPEAWSDDFCALSPELIRHLHARGVVLVGLDTPSVDPAPSKQLESHAALLATGMGVLEGLDLSKVPSGDYTLIALPLNLESAEASPVRAVLVEGAIS